MREFYLLFCLATCLILSLGCRSNETEESQGTSQNVETTSNEKVTTRPVSRLSQFKPKLSDYELYAGVMAELQPSTGVVEYELNSTLFTDYASKQRLVKLPDQASMVYSETGTLGFPVGTVIAKTFYYDDCGSPDAPERRIIETRILEHREEGWIGIPYVWKEDQSDAVLSIAGAMTQVVRHDAHGENLQHDYAVPNLNDCKRCHTGDSTEPIGPKARNLNRIVEIDGRSVNQLAEWAAKNILTGLPSIESIPSMVAWDDPSASLDQRARAYLDINCAHCHSANGPARNSGLHLDLDESDHYRLGYFKSPIAAGKGTGGRQYAIVPGKPDESILEYRMRTLLPGEVMPEFGKALVHEEGLELIRSWIQQLNP